MRLMRQITIVTHHCLWHGIFPKMYNRNRQVVIVLLVCAASSRSEEAGKETATRSEIMRKHLLYKT